MTDVEAAYRASLRRAAARKGISVEDLILQDAKAYAAAYAADYDAYLRRVSAAAQAARAAV